MSNEKNTWIMALDTCTGHLSVAFYNPQTGQEKVVKKPMVKGLFEALFPTIKEQLNELNITFENIAAIAVTRGPGSFTSVRIGLTAVKGFVFESSRKAYAWNTLEVLAKQYGKPCQVWLAAHGKNVFVQSFKENGVADGEPSSMKIDQAVANAKGIVIGDGLFKYPMALENAEWLEDEQFHSVDPLFLAKQTAKLAEGDARQGNLTALYVHPLDYDKTGA